LTVTVYSRPKTKPEIPRQFKSIQTQVISIKPSEVELEYRDGVFEARMGEADGGRVPLSSEYGTHKTVKANFWS